MLQVHNKLYAKFIVELGFHWLIVVGDITHMTYYRALCKTYDILQNLRPQYGSQMQWVLPFPGDWHVLYNHQKVLLKIYGEAGLLQLAKVAGHRAKTLKSLAQASHFKRTHNFIIQSFEAMYRCFVRTYLSTIESDSSQVVTSTANTLAIALASVTSDVGLEKLLEQLKATFNTTLLDLTLTVGFRAFMEDLCKSKKTCHFWHEYLTLNSLIYMALFIAIRNADWMLRMAAIKSVAAVFCAFNRPIYQNLTPQALS